MGKVELVEFKGRRGMETVFPRIARGTSGTTGPGATHDFAVPATGEPEDDVDQCP